MNINLTRQQLAILGSLLLAGHLVFCCFGYTLGRGLRPNRPHHMKRHYLTKVLVLLIVALFLLACGPTPPAICQFCLEG
jgi:hypothetical protein